MYGNCQFHFHSVQTYFLENKHATYYLESTCCCVYSISTFQENSFLLVENWPLIKVQVIYNHRQRFLKGFNKQYKNEFKHMCKLSMMQYGCKNIKHLVNIGFNIPWCICFVLPSKTVFCKAISDLVLVRVHYHKW